MRNWQKWLDLQNDRIKNSQGSLVKKELTSISLKSIPRIHLASVLDLARRLQLNYLILRGLQHLVQPQFRSDSAKRATLPPSSFEIALYALALARIGAHTEAWSLLDPLPNNDHQILFVKASALVSQWNYRQAQNYFKMYLKHPAVSDYQKLIGHLNLAACYLFQQKIVLADRHLSKFSNLENKFPLLVANSLELKAQLFIAQGLYDLAFHGAREAIELLKTSGSAYSLFSEKWAIIAHALKTQTTSGSFSINNTLTSWENFKDRCVQGRQFEIVRDLDLYESIIKKDSILQEQVIFGTSFLSYRKHAENLIGRKVTHKPFLSQSQGVAPEFVFNVRQKLILQNNRVLKLKKQSSTVIWILTQDRYRSLPLGEMFDLLYPGEKFNVWSSPARVYKAIQYARTELALHKIPLEIEIFKKAVRLISGKSFALLYNQESIPYLQNSHWQEIVIWLQARERSHFTRQQYMDHFNLGRSLAINKLNLFIKEKSLRVEGKGSRRFYHLTSTKQRRGTSVIT